MSPFFNLDIKRMLFPDGVFIHYYDMDYGVILNIAVPNKWRVLSGHNREGYFLWVLLSIFISEDERSKSYGD